MSSLSLDAYLMADLRFTVDWPVWLVVTVSIAMGIATMMLYLRETRTLSSPWSWLLPGMRGTAVVLACLLLAGPTWHRRQVIGTPARVVWAIDRSASMGESDSQASTQGDSSESRLRRATDLLFGGPEQRGWIDRLSETHAMEVHVFDRQSREVWDSDSNELVPGSEPDSRSSYDSSVADSLEHADGTDTDLSSPLQTALDRTLRDISTLAENDHSNDSDQAPERILVLMSDGRDSVQRVDAADTSRKLAQSGWQVHAVGMGSLDEPPDVGVVDVDAPQRVADDGRLAGQIYLKHFGVRDRSVRVQIRSGDTVVWSQEIAIDTDGKTPVAFDFPVDQLMNRISGQDLRGVDRDSVVLPLTAEVVTSTGDSDGTATMVGKPGNDSIDFRVAAASRDRELLILDGSSRWEIRYLRNLFTRDPAWRVDTILFGEGTDQEKVKRGEDPGQLPGSSRAWSRYDAVVLGEIPANQWTREDALRLSEFVSRGGGLIVIDGRYDRIRTLLDSPDPEQPNLMAELIPVRFDSDDLATNPPNNPVSTIQRIEPTDAGAQHPVMLLDSEAKPITKAWQSLPAPQSIAASEPQLDAEVWAEAVDQEDQRQPWLVTRLFGAGRVFYLASDETWRWRYKVESRLHRRFWTQLMTAAMQPPYAVRDEFVAIGTDKVDYDIGQSATIRVRLLQDNQGGINASSNAEAGSILDATTVDALLLENEQVVGTIAMRLEDPQRRTYVGQTLPLPAGKYDVRIRASGYDASALKASSPIWVQAPRSGELDRTSVDEPSLSRIAQAGGGRYVHESSVEELFDQIAPLSRGRILESDTALWQTWWVFLSIVCLLALEWWARKKVGLM
ncbi:VWA domain-containing protein [Neorhodopirellula pilleata]|uniref:VWFA domain-containing protein n=1 Tax=Neorhodopirellula pilleata TaxID=2714738 RepID=A0A5C6B058_9BACT|nr:VWA domain-containing protein [Neorhodopirellula pilleata]TWU03794.1 hypothetical protein Pla100_07240 [Neorhodopirellula pilleata]